MKKYFLLSIFFVAFLLCTTTIHASSSVVINEIAWMGTTTSANDEWMELYNPTDSSIDVSGWKLTSADEKIKIALKGEISAKGFYLLERTDDTTVPGVTADIIYKGSLNNAGQDLRLYNNEGTLIDEINYPSKWPAGDNKTKQTLEKNAGNWQTSSDANGTPRSQNSLGAAIVVSTPKETTKKETTPEVPKEENNTIPEITPEIKAYSKGVVINEVLPSPENSDETSEWIELYNQSDTEVHLEGWKIQDTQGTITNYTFPKSTILLANGYIALKRPETKITLNNDQDGIELVWPNGEIADSMSFTSAPKNQSYNNIGGNWQWSTTKTPDAKNSVTTPIIVSKTKVLPKSNKTVNKNAADATVASIGESLTPFNNSDQESSHYNPWFLFFIALGITIASGIIIVIIKIVFKKSNHERSQSF